MPEENKFIDTREDLYRYLLGDTKPASQTSDEKGNDDNKKDS